MKLSTKPRHWLALIVAIPVMIVSVITALDFSGEPQPQWRRNFNGIGTTLVLILITTNILLDRREDDSK